MTVDGLKGFPSFEDKVVVVTGASTGLGAQFAAALDHFGARLVLAARRAERLEQLAETLREAHVVPCDLSQEEDRLRLVEEAVRRFGRIDGLVNNAGSTEIEIALRQSTEDFRRMLEINLVAPFAVARETVRHMRTTGGGAIVNIASVSALQALPVAPEPGYVAAKAGLAGLTRELATEWARYDVRVNAIAPGAFPTAITASSLEEGTAEAEWFRQRVPLGRTGREGEVDTLVLTLLHPATSYVTGQLFVVDGGLTIA